MEMGMVKNSAYIMDIDFYRTTEGRGNVCILVESFS